MEKVKTSESSASEKKRAINWILIIANLIIISSTLLTWYSEGLGRIGGASESTLFNTGSGLYFSVLAVINLIFIFLHKQLPTFVVSALLILLAALQIEATVSEIPYYFDFSFGIGFYTMILGIALLIASYPLFGAIQKKKAGL